MLNLLPWILFEQFPENHVQPDTHDSPTNHPDATYHPISNTTNILEKSYLTLLFFIPHQSMSSHSKPYTNKWVEEVIYH